MRVPVPIRPSPQDLPHWEGAREGRLVLQRCEGCGLVRHPPGPVCSRCGSSAAAWTEVAPGGSLVAHVVFHKAYSPELEDDLPYAVGLVRLDAGPAMVTRLLGRESSAWSAGARVQATFDVAVGEWRLPCFGPGGSPAGTVTAGRAAPARARRARGRAPGRPSQP